VLGKPSRFGLGFQLSQPTRRMGRGEGCYGHFGYGGTLGFADPESGVAFGYLMNRPGERWRKGAHRAHAVIETEPWVAVCFDAPLCELVRAGQTPELVAKLGPDLLDPDADLDEAVRRMRARADLPLGVAVMRQHLVSGIGNVYKSETLFIRRADPFAPVASYDDAALRAILGEAQRLMRLNTARNARRTRHRLRGDRLWVYGRGGKPCLECGAAVRMRRQGDEGRSTYFCPRCQSASQ